MSNYSDFNEEGTQKIKTKKQEEEEVKEEKIK